MKLSSLLPSVRPTLMDRLVGWADPVRGMQRLRARAGMMILSGDGGGYDAGRSDKTSLQRYNPRVGSARTDIHPGLSTIRSRSRDQVRNNPLAAGAVGSTVTSVVGSGLTVQPSIDQELLGLSDEEADAWERQATRVWSLWADTTECDLESEANFGEIQNLIFRGALESGDILRMRRFVWDGQTRRPRGGDFFGTKVQLIEADRVSNPHYQADTTQIAGGVEVNEDGRRVRYWVQTAHPGDHFGFRRTGEWTPVPVRDPRTNQRVAQLLFRKERPGQRRGVPYLAPVIQQLKQLERYSEAELMAAVVASMFTVFVRSEAPADAGPLQGITDDDDTPDSDGELFLGNGLVQDLDPGESVDIADPKRPNAQFDPFFVSVTRLVGVALELPYEVLVKHFQSSYSASRGALLEAWKFYRSRRHWLVTTTCQPCYEDVISEAVARGMISAPGFFGSPVVRRAWLGTQWTGDAMPQIDPLKEAGAAKLRIDTGTSTIDREAREANGSSFEANHHQLRKEQRMRQEDGLQAESAGGVVIAETRESDEGESTTETRLIGAGGGK